MVLQKHHRAIRREFDRQAPSWTSVEVGEPLRWVVDRLTLHSELEVLDVAAGTAQLGGAIAPHVRSVTAVDLSPRMLELGARRAAELGIGNINFVQGSAEHLPFSDASFDLAVSRYAIHHVVDAAQVLGEIARVLRPGGSVTIVDMLSNDDPEIALRQNELERAVDPTHTRMLTMREFLSAFADVKLQVISHPERGVAVDFECWQSHLMDDDPNKVAVRRALMEELYGGAATGFRPFLEGERLHFYHTWGVISARKAGTSS